MIADESSFEAHGAAPAPEPVPLTEQDIHLAEEFRRQQQLAVLVVMFSDIEKSTNLLESKGEIAYAKLRRQHDEIVRTVVEKDDSGRCVKHLGDGFMALFAEPSTAVERCIELQQRISRECGIRIRIGLDMGQIAVEKAGGTTRDAFGRFVNRAARINAAAGGGQTFASYNVWDSAIGWLSPESIAWRDLGELKVKGFTNAVHCYEFYDATGALHQPVPDPPKPVASQPALPSPVPAQQPYREGKYKIVTVGTEAREVLEKALRDARTLLLARQYPAALRSLQAANPLLPAAPVDLQQQYQALKAEAEKGASRLLKEQDLKGTIVAGSLDMEKTMVAGPSAAPRRAPVPIPPLKRLKAWLRGGPSPKKILWFDEIPGKRAFIQGQLVQRGAELDIFSDTMAAFKRLARKKHELVVLVADNAKEGIRCVQFVELIRQEGLKTPAVLFSNVRTSYKLAEEAAKLKNFRCASSLSELATLIGA